jgi:hypothetical protein
MYYFDNFLLFSDVTLNLVLEMIVNLMTLYEILILKIDTDADALVKITNGYGDWTIHRATCLFNHKKNRSFDVSYRRT